MTDPIQRWYVKRAYCVQHDTGDFVLAADAEAHEAAAVAAAEARAEQRYLDGHDCGYADGKHDAHAEFLTPAALAACGPDDPRYAKGQRDERARIRAGVADLFADPADGSRPRWGLADVVAVIDAAPQEEPCAKCGEPVAYLPARVGWAGGWLHRTATTDGHTAAPQDEKECYCGHGRSQHYSGSHNPECHVCECSTFSARAAAPQEPTCP